MTAPVAPILGFNCKLYYNTGTYGTPTWVLIDNVGDLTLPLEASEASITTRNGGGFEQVVAGLIKFGLEFKMVYDPADAAQTAFRNAFFARSSLEFAAMDQAIATAGSAGMRATCAITKFAIDENLGDAVMVNIAAKPTKAANAPAWYTAS